MENNEREIMSETEKRFKVQRIEKYKEMIDETEKSNASRTVELGMCALVIIFGAVMAGHEFNNHDLIGGVVDMILALAFSGVTSKLVLKPLLDNISKKTSLQTNLNMLNDELDLNETLEEEQEQKTKTL